MKRGILRDAFPAIREIILTESPRLGRPIDKYDIGPKLKEHPRVRPLLRTGYKGEQGSVDEYTRNLVDWYSHKWTQYEANELHSGQSDWILPTFEGIRRTGGSGSGHAWRYEPDNVQTVDPTNDPESRVARLLSNLDLSPRRHVSHKTLEEQIEIYNAIPAEAIGVHVSVSEYLPSGERREREFGPFMALYIMEDELVAYYSEDDWETIAMRVGTDWYLAGDELPVRELLIIGHVERSAL